MTVSLQAAQIVVAHLWQRASAHLVWGMVRWWWPSWWGLGRPVALGGMMTSPWGPSRPWARSWPMWSGLVAMMVRVPVMLGVFWVVVVMVVVLGLDWGFAGGCGFLGLVARLGVLLWELGWCWVSEGQVVLVVGVGCYWRRVDGIRVVEGGDYDGGDGLVFWEVSVLPVELAGGQGCGAGEVYGSAAE